MVSVVTKIEMADASAAVSLKDSKTEKVVEIVVSDQETLDKFKDHRIGVGDEVRCKNETEGEKNKSKLFRKNGGLLMTGIRMTKKREGCVIVSPPGEVQ